MNHEAPSFLIAGRKVGLNHPPLVIAEIGINHNGSLDVAIEMVDAAFRAGAEVIKHQTHIVEDEMSEAAKSVVPGNADKSIYEIIKGCSLNYNDELKLMRYVENLGMIFISTPFSRAAFYRLEEFSVKAYKIGSGECNNYPLIELIARTKKPVILSTGMNDINSIQKAVNIFQQNGCPYALLHCTNIYPTPAHLVRLKCLNELQQAFPGAVVGLSDHTVNNNTCLASVALGASILERHFTDHKKRIGPDICCSMDELELAQLINGSREIHSAMSGGKVGLEEEQVTKNFAFATVVAECTLNPGDILTEKNIWVKRPGIGEIIAEQYSSLFGRVMKSRVEKDQHLSWSDIL